MITAVLLPHVTSLEFYESRVKDSKPKFEFHLILHYIYLFSIYTPLAPEKAAVSTSQAQLSNFEYMLSP